MERKNTILLTVIAIATLLVAVVGATFAYFTASTNVKTPTGANANITTNKLEGANITFTADKNFDLLDYPGGIGVYGSKATIAKQNDGDNNDYESTFNLKIEYNNGTNTDMQWELWMVESEYDELEAEKTSICKFREERNGETGETQYWYSDDTSQEATEDTGCTATNIINKLQNQLSGKKIANGVFKAGQNKTIDKNTTGDELVKGVGLDDRKINTNNMPSKYYYLVIKYPNENKNQSTLDAGKTFTASLSVDGTPASTLYKAAD